jgi:hypothetical protein
LWLNIQRSSKLFSGVGFSINRTGWPDAGIQGIEMACVGRGGMKLIDVVQKRLQSKYQPATCRIYELWIRRYLRYHLPAHPREVGQNGVTGFV